MTPQQPKGKISSKDLTFAVKRAKHAGRISTLLKENEDAIDLFVVTTAMSKLKKWGKAKDALKIFNDATKKGVVHDAVTFNSAISASASLSDWKQSFDLFQAMEDRGLEPDIITYTALISACNRAGEWQKALDLMDDMKQTGGLTLDIITYSALIAACEKGGQWEKALELFDEMKWNGLEPNIVTYSSLISACVRGGQVDRAVELYDELKRHDLKPNIFTYSAMIEACEATDSDDEKVRKFFVDAYLSGVLPRLNSTKTGTLDLGALPIPIARAALRVALDDLRRPSENRCFFHHDPTSKDLRIYVGRETNRSEPGLRSVISVLLHDEYPQLDVSQDPKVPGALAVGASSLQKWISQ